MYFTSNHEHEREAPAGAGREDAQHRADGARRASRVVTRDERNPQGKPPARAETSNLGFDPDYEGEIYRLESRGKRDTFIAHPIPRESADSEVAHIDWFSFTIKPPRFKTQQWVMAELGRLLGFLRITPRKHGLYGYEHSAIIEEGGLMAWGGKNQRGTVYVSLNGQGCSRVADWRALQSWCQCYEIKITRIDFAHDDFEGRTVNIEKVLEWYKAGGFNAGGRPPKTAVNGDWLGGECGRTVYIGDRASGKQACAYEKGKQLGDPGSTWFRFEGRLSGKDRDIPLDALTRPGQYLAGMYPCLCFLSVIQCKVKTVRRAAKASYEKAVKGARQQYGKLVTVMLQAHGGDYVAVVHDLMRDGVPARLDPYSYHLRTNPALINALAGGSSDDAALVAG